MKKTIFAACCLLLTTGQAFAGEGVPAEVPTLVELSDREINRIVCPGQMTDLIFSEEKGLTGHFSGNNAFIKFTAEEVGGNHHRCTDGDQRGHCPAGSAQERDCGQEYCPLQKHAAGEAGPATHQGGL
jgi:hypothetical protein